MEVLDPGKTLGSPSGAKDAGIPFWKDRLAPRWLTHPTLTGYKCYKKFVYKQNVASQKMQFYFVSLLFLLIRHCFVFISILRAP